MPAVSVLIKPSSSNCNMRCRYCFYHDLADNREVGSRGFMNSQTAENIVKKLFDVAERHVTIAFQGGEPTLIGLDFFREFVETVKKYNIKNIPVSYGLQTNGTTLDENWCRFFCDNKFLLGVSLDGDKEIHDSLRYVNSHGAYNKVMQNIKLLQKHNVDFNVLIVVTSFLAAHYERIYKNLKKAGLKYLQFIPCLDAVDGHKQKFSLTPEGYAKFLIGIFRLWKRDYDNGEYISIRHIDNTVSVLQGKRPELCTMNGHCSIQNIIEADGTVYPCDFFCADGYELGNINDEATSFRTLFESETAQNFLKESMVKSSDCYACEFFKVCKGACKREYKDGKSVFCEAYKQWYDVLIKEYNKS